MEKTDTPNMFYINHHSKWMSWRVEKELVSEAEMIGASNMFCMNHQLYVDATGGKKRRSA